MAERPRERRVQARPSGVPVEKPQVNQRDKELVAERFRARERGERDLALRDVRAGGYRPRTKTKSGRRWGIWLAAIAVLLVVGYIVVPPLAGGFVRTLAEANPDLMRIGLVADTVGQVMDDRPDKPAGIDPSPVQFVIQPGMSSGEIIEQLVSVDLVTDRLAFTYVLAQDGGLSRLQAGTHVLARTMTPRQVAQALEGAPGPAANEVSVALRQGLRLEQIVAYLQTLPLDNLDIEQFDELATAPPDSLRAKFPWLSVVPVGKSLEGFLGAGIFDVPANIDAEGMIETLLQRWQDSPAYQLLTQAQQSGVNFYDAVTLGSIVEREASVDEERPLIAGVFQNRLNGMTGTKLLEADSVVVYVKDSLNLQELHISQWPDYEFWTVNDLGSPSDFEVPAELFGYQVYHSRGLPPTPICTPGLASLEAALNPDTSEGYLYFVAKNDGTHTHAFARTYAEHLANIQRYIYGGSPIPSGSISPSPSSALTPTTTP